MHRLGAQFLLNIIIFRLANGKPFVDQGRLLTRGNSHEASRELGNVEGEAHFRFRAFLENLKADFLRSLNLSEVPSQEKTKEEPPQFMIDLYNRYTKDKSSSPISNIVRSFSPEDVTLPEMNSLQKYILPFNVSIPQHEEVSRAELRIHIACQEKTVCLSHVQGRLSVHDTLGGDDWEQPKGTNYFPVSKDIHECGWVMFDVSGTVKRWVRIDKTKASNQLVISVESHVPYDPSCEKLRLSVTPDSTHLPLLIVFSNDNNNRIKENHEELQEMMAHEQESILQNVVKNHTVHKHNAVSGNGIRRPSTRSKRSVELDHCRRTSLRVNFKEIGWNWIIAPQDYEAFECKGGCFFPLTDNVTPTKHAIVQTLVHYKNPKKASKACCVPTKLDAISMLYNDDAGTPTLKYQYEGMKVAECGCR
ncbi:growth/differentiation factor 2 [Eublepharis macularius]|uniref:Growth/differentiation factor 2 n=1 Tax=Eublepharis macularius TaxID=481883 RepID=A0AA97L2I7_EUBMA|nr:growth/differentiation factor 2 [Eublepharis macularius]